MYHQKNTRGALAQLAPLWHLEISVKVLLSIQFQSSPKSFKYKVSSILTQFPAEFTGYSRLMDTYILLHYF